MFIAQGCNRLCWEMKKLFMQKVDQDCQTFLKKIHCLQQQEKQMFDLDFDFTSSICSTAAENKAL